MAYLVDGTVGVDLTTTPTTAEFTLGQQHTGTDSTVWVYVQASGAITQYDTVAIDENFQAAALTDTLAGSGHSIGFAQVAFTDNDYGWVATEGTNIQCRVAASCVQDTKLYSFTIAGVLDDASSAGAVGIHGVVAVASVSTATTNTEIIARAPYCDWSSL